MHCARRTMVHIHMSMWKNYNSNRGETCVSMLVKVKDMYKESCNSLVLSKGCGFVLQADDGDRMFEQWGGDYFRVGLCTGVSKDFYYDTWCLYCIIKNRSSAVVIMSLFKKF